MPYSNFETLRPNYQSLPEGNVAIIVSKSIDTVPGNNFTAAIGIVRRYKDMRELESGPIPEFDDYDVPIDYGMYKGIVSIKPVLKSKIFIRLIAQRDTLGDVELGLHNENWGKLPRVSKVPSEYIKEQGFDLKKENLDNEGKILSKDLSQMLYDFQLEQGQFNKTWSHRLGD